MPRPDDPRLKALAELVHQLRPAWNRGGILSAIHACQRPGRDLPSIVRAAIDAALDPTADTPGAIQHRDGAAWNTTPKPTRSPADRSPCAGCGNIHSADDKTCQYRDPATAHAGADRARAALRGGQ